MLAASISLPPPCLAYTPPHRGTSPLSPREQGSLFSNIPTTPYLSHRSFSESRRPEPHLTHQTLTGSSLRPCSLHFSFFFFHSCTLSALPPSPQQSFTGADSTPGSAPGQPPQVGHPPKMGGAVGILPFHVRAIYPFFSLLTLLQKSPHVLLVSHIL